LWVEAADDDALSAVHRALVSLGSPVEVLVVGKGSNLLVSDAGFRGLALALGAGFDGAQIDGDVVDAGGAMALPALARRTAAAGLRGLEWAVGVPGSVGGALRMNAGGHGSDTAHVLAAYRLFDLRTGVFSRHVATEFAGAYRRSSLGPTDVGVAARFGLRHGDVEEAKALVSEIVRWRRDHQPGGSNAGSVFTNPDGTAAAALVEHCGLKGRRLGSAQVSEKHANFIQADDGGSADDVRRLVDLVRAEVARQTGVDLVPELHMVGFADSPTLVLEATGEPSTSTGGRG
jgi:UDP-N-acetylmuramate dehydrogenase